MKRRLESNPRALTIAGSDSNGEAGIQADLRTFTLLRTAGATVITCLTAQNRRVISQIEPCSARMVRAQLEAVFEDSPPRAVKTGMLYSAAIVGEVVRFFQLHPSIPLVVDPVMIATSGRRLLLRNAEKILREKLLPLAFLMTPNRAEAEVLTDSKIQSPEEARCAARRLQESFGCAALVKGGHLSTAAQAIDFLFDGEEEWMLSAPRRQGLPLHGTGCVYSAAITAGLAHGLALKQAVALGKNFVTQTIYESRQARTVSANVSG